MNPIELSLIIPTYNEEELIEEALLTLDDIVKDRNLPYEIVVVDDGSKDQTLHKAKMYASRNHHVRVVSYSENVGKGYAIKKGFTQSNGQFLLFVDSDMDIDLGSTASYIDALEDADIVVATKWHRNSNVEMPLVRKILSHGFNLLVRLFTGTKYKDTQVGLKAIRRSAFENIFPRLCVKRYAFDVELLAVAELNGLKIVEMPVNLKVKEKFKIKQIFYMFIDLLGIAYRLRVTHWYQRQIP